MRSGKDLTHLSVVERVFARHSFSKSNSFCYSNCACVLSYCTCVIFDVYSLASEICFDELSLFVSIFECSRWSLRDWLGGFPKLVYGSKYGLWTVPDLNLSTYAQLPYFACEVENNLVFSLNKVVVESRAFGLMTRASGELSSSTLLFQAELTQGHCSWKCVYMSAILDISFWHSKPNKGTTHSFNVNKSFVGNSSSLMISETLSQISDNQNLLMA